LEIIAYQNEFCILRALKTAGLAQLGGWGHPPLRGSW